MMSVKTRRARLHQSPPSCEEPAPAKAQERGAARLWKRLAAPAAIILWPFVYLFNYVVPVSGQYLALERDFPLYYYRYKLYLLAHLAEGRFPLWSPSEAAGFPFFSSPLTQAFYPLNLGLVVWYKLVGGFSPLDYQIFTIAGLSIFGLGLYYWLRQLTRNALAPLFSALLLTVCFRMVESLRFPNAIHTAAWYPWVLYGMTRLATSEHARERIGSCLVLICSGICICTAGYPYFLYYSLFLFIPYFLLLVLPVSKRLILDVNNVRWKQVSFCIGTSGVVTGLLCTPYLLAVKRLLALTYNRDGDSFEYSTSHNFDFADTVGSLIYPPLAQWEGWYFFSLTGVLLIVLLLLYCLVTRLMGKTGETVDNDASRWRASTCILISWIAVCSYISYGKESHLFTFLWHWMPGFSSLRVWGRFSVVLIPLWAWLLTLAYEAFEKLAFHDKLRTGSFRKSLLFPFTLAYALLLWMQYYFYDANLTDPYWDRYATEYEGLRINFLLTGCAAFAVLFFLLAVQPTFLKRLKKPRWIICGLLLTVAVLEMRPVGGRIWGVWRPVPSEHTAMDPAVCYRDSFLIPRVDQRNTVSFSPEYSIAVTGPSWYFDHYVRFYQASNKEQQNRRILFGIQDGQKVFFSESLRHSSIGSFLADSRRFTNPGHLVAYNGDVLVWEIHAPRDGYLSFIDNNDPYWKVRVDGEEQKMESLFGIFKSVFLKTGSHRVEFRYQPTIRAILLGTQDHSKERHGTF